MGSSTSKPARKLANHATSTISRHADAPSAAAVAATRRPSPPSTASSPSTQQSSGAPDAYDPRFAPSRSEATRQQQGRASETKTQDIMRDASDPQLLQNLARLGAVNVPKHSTNYQPTDQMLRILAARSKASMDPLDAPSPSTSSSSPAAAGTTTTGDRMPVGTLTSLLEDRKHCTTPADLDRLAIEYDLPLSIIESLAVVFNSPTMGEEIREDERKREKDPNSPAKFRTMWVEAELAPGQKGSGKEDWKRIEA